MMVRASWAGAEDEDESSGGEEDEEKLSHAALTAAYRSELARERAELEGFLRDEAVYRGGQELLERTAPLSVAVSDSHDSDASNNNNHGQGHALAAWYGSPSPALIDQPPPVPSPRRREEAAPGVDAVPVVDAAEAASLRDELAKLRAERSRVAESHRQLDRAMDELRSSTAVAEERDREEVEALERSGEAALNAVRRERRAFEARRTSAAVDDPDEAHAALDAEMEGMRATVTQLKVTAEVRRKRRGAVEKKCRDENAEQTRRVTELTEAVRRLEAEALEAAARRAQQLRPKTTGRDVRSRRSTSVERRPRGSSVERRPRGSSAEPPARRRGASTEAPARRRTGSVEPPLRRSVEDRSPLWRSGNDDFAPSKSQQLFETSVVDDPPQTKVVNHRRGPSVVVVPSSSSSSRAEGESTPPRGAAPLSTDSRHFSLRRGSPAATRAGPSLPAAPTAALEPKTVRYKNGTTKTTEADGRVVVRFANGDVKRVEPTGKVVYYYAEARTTHTTDPADHLEIFEFPNGQIERHASDGSKEIVFPDGTRRLVDAAGRSRTVFADGAVVEGDEALEEHHPS